MAPPSIASDIRLITVCRENEDDGARNSFEHLTGGLQTIEQWHGDIHNDDGRTKMFDQGDCLAAVARFTDHFEVVFQFQDLPKPFTYNFMVFYEQNSDFNHRFSISVQFCSSFFRAEPALSSHFGHVSRHLLINVEH
jgi:hypothetical protein